MRALPLVAALLLAATAAAAADRPLTIASNVEPDTLDISSTRNALSVRPILGNNTYEDLVRLDNQGHLAPGLATSWTISPDARLFEFHLRPGVRFQSGDPLTSADIAFSVARESKRAPQSARHLGLIDHVETPDDLTARIVFKTADPGFLQARQVPVVSKAYYDRVGEDQFVAYPVGTGPYRISAYAGGQSLDLAAFDGYWGGAPKIPAARFVFVKDNATRVAKIKAGEADMVMNSPFAAVADLRAAGFHLVQVAVHPTVSLQMQVTDPDTPWHKRDVRLAMAEAIDANAIVAGLLKGVPRRFAALSPGELGYDPGLAPYPYDPADAKKLLAAAGYGGGFKMPLYYWANSYEGVQDTAEAVALYLKQVGIEADIHPLDGTQLLDMVRKAHNEQKTEFVSVSPLPLANTPDPADSVYFAYSSGSVYSVYANPDFDREATAAEQAVDLDQRAAHTKAAVAILHQDVGSIPFWSNVATYAMTKGIDYTPVLHDYAGLILANVTLGTAK